MTFILNKMKPQIFLENQQLLRNKAIFLYFCNHFKNLSLASLLNDKIFMQHMHSLVHGEPTLHSRAFQLALEVTYFKRYFGHDALQEIYKNDFIVKDVFNVNNGLCDQSTIFTAILAKNLTDYFNFNIQDVVVNSTPLFLTKEKITPEMHHEMDYNKAMTQNTCNDIAIRNHPYDFKESKGTSYGKNHIYFIDKAEMSRKGDALLFRLEKYLDDCSNNVQKNISQESQVFASELLLSLRGASNTCAENRFDILNKFILKKSIPQDFKMPLFILSKKAHLESLPVTEDLEKVTLDKGHLDSTKAKKAIMGILETFDSDLKSDIRKITHNSIQFTLQNNEGVD